jgi:hypothetical protein
VLKYINERGDTIFEVSFRISLQIKIKNKLRTKTEYIQLKINYFGLQMQVDTKFIKNE